MSVSIRSFYVWQCQFLTVGTHAQRGLQYLVRKCVCPSVSVCYHVFCHYAQQTGKKAISTQAKGGTIQSTFSCHRLKCLSYRTPTSFHVRIVCFASHKNTQCIGLIIWQHTTSKGGSKTSSKYFTPH